jgi:probable phosphoglycerate mutase
VPQPPEFTRLVIVRHGETEFNREGRYMNQLDSPLTELGICQVKALAERLSHYRFTAFYSSDLGRTVATSKIISARCGGSPVFRAGLREHAMGHFQGLKLEDARTQFAEDWSRFNAEEDYAIGDGESRRTFQDRVAGTVSEILSAHHGETILVVCHGGVLEILFRYAMEQPLNCPRRVRIPNCALNEFHVLETHWMLMTWGDVSHLMGLEE